VEGEEDVEEEEAAGVGVAGETKCLYGHNVVTTLG